MSSIINSDNGAVSGSAGLKTDAGTPGNLVLQTNGVTAVTVTNSQNVAVSGNLTAVGNISGSYILGNGSQLTGLPEGYGNADVAAYLPTYTGNLVSLTGDVVTTGNISTGALSVSGNVVSSGTGFMQIPVGNTAQRPVSPINGMIRFNTTLSYPEWYDETYSMWSPFFDSASYSIQYLIVAGGGGGGVRHGGGGGAGGFISGAITVTPSQPYSLVVGGGGAAGIADSTHAQNGSNSTGFSQTAIGGGGGGQFQTAGNVNASGNSGGSGGGAGNQSTSSAGSGTTGQGNAGGAVTAYGDAWSGAGGGGAGGAGQNQTNANIGGNGGNGSIWLNGTTYAGGGGGAGGTSGTPGSGGTGGGGAGSVCSDSATSGTANTGGGGGGARCATAAGSGGSGIIIIRYLGPQRGSGGTISFNEGYTYHTFTSSGTFIS